MRRRRWAAVVAFLVGIVLAGSLPAPDLGVAEDDEGDVVSIVWTDGLALGDFLMINSRLTGISFIWDPPALPLMDQPVVCTGDLQCRQQEVLQVLRSILVAHDLILVKRGGTDTPVYRVVLLRSVEEASRLEPVLLDLDDETADRWEQADGIFVSATLRAEHLADLDRVVVALRPLVTARGIGSVAAVEEAKAVTVTDFAPNVVACWRLVRALDRMAEPAPVAETHAGHVVAIVHADAATLAKGLSAHFGAGASPAPDGLRILADERTNQIVVNGRPQEVSDVLETIRLLDLPAAGPSTWIHVIELKHVGADGVARVLQSLIRADPALWRAGSTPQHVVALPVVVAHPETDSLLIQATSRAFEQLAAVVRRLDRPVENEAKEKAPDERPSETDNDTE